MCDFWYGEKQQKVCRTDLAVGVAGQAVQSMAVVTEN